MPPFIFDASVAAAGETKSRLKANILTTRENVYRVVKQAIAVANDQDVNFNAHAKSLIKILGGEYQTAQDVASARRSAAVAVASMVESLSPSNRLDLPTPTYLPANRIASNREIYLSPTTIKTLVSLSEAAHKKDPSKIAFTPELVIKVVEAIHKRTYPDGDPANFDHMECALEDGSFQSLIRATRMVLFNPDPVKSTYQGFAGEWCHMSFTDMNPEHFEPRGPLNVATGTATVEKRTRLPPKPAQAPIVPNTDKKQKTFGKEAIR